MNSIFLYHLKHNLYLIYRYFIYTLVKSNFHVKIKCMFYNNSGPNFHFAMINYTKLIVVDLLGIFDFLYSSTIRFG